MSAIKLAYIDTKYIKYLYHYDNRVAYNKGAKRPYIGILFTVRGHSYYAPLSSYKPKFLTMKNDWDFMRIKGGKLGAINFNNMIPTRQEAVNLINVSNIADQKYKMLLINQIRFFDEKETDIINRATKLYRAYKTKKLRNSIFQRCCDFSLLEKMSKRYNPNYKPKQTN